MLDMKRREFITLLGGAVGLAVSGARAAAGHAGGWFSPWRVSWDADSLYRRVPSGPEGNRSY